jgi:hypothetical protein
MRDPGSAAWVVYLSEVAKSSPDGDDELKGRSPVDEPQYQVFVQRMWPFGIRSRPPTGTPGVAVFPNANASCGILTGAESSEYGPSDLEEGETALYNLIGTFVKAWADGKLTIDSNEGKDIVVNGGSAKVGRVGDAVAAGTTMAAWITNVISALATLGEVVAPPVDFGVIAEGANKFKA